MSGGLEGYSCGGLEVGSSRNVQFLMSGCLEV